jgi:hypothetical protein
MHRTLAGPLAQRYTGRPRARWSARAASRVFFSHAQVREALATDDIESVAVGGDFLICIRRPVVSSSRPPESTAGTSSSVPPGGDDSEAAQADLLIAGRAVACGPLAHGRLPTKGRGTWTLTLSLRPSIEYFHDHVFKPARVSISRFLHPSLGQRPTVKMVACGGKHFLLLTHSGQVRLPRCW